jgi:dihydrofolate reductase
VVRKVVAFEWLSLDGVAEDPDAFMTSWDEVMDEHLAQVISSQDTVLLGHRTYDDWAAFWPSSDIEPFATFINGVEKFVAVSTVPASDWGNVTFVEGDFAAFVAELKQRPGGDIGVHGSIELVQSLLKAKLVDELRLVVTPVVQGGGRRLFEETPTLQLILTRHEVSPSGSLLLDYLVATE